MARFIPILRPLRSSHLDPTALISHHLPLADGVRAWTPVSNIEDFYTE